MTDQPGNCTILTEPYCLPDGRRPGQASKQSALSVTVASGCLSGFQAERMPGQRTVLHPVTPSREHCNHQGRLNHELTWGQLGSKGYKQVQGPEWVRIKGTCWEQNPLHCEAWRRGGLSSARKALHSPETRPAVQNNRDGSEQRWESQARPRALL